jgi:flagellar FliL protein
MSEAEETTPPRKKSKLPLILGVVLMLALGGGGFYAVFKGMILAPKHEGDGETAADAPLAPLPDVGFVAVDPMIVTVGLGATSRQLRFSSQIEVAKGHEEEVRALLPRVMDVMNTYLRAVDAREFQQPAALVRLRANLTRRVQLVAGGDRVRDILVTEFVVN